MITIVDFFHTDDIRIMLFNEGIDIFNIGGRDRMVVGFIPTCAISVYPH